MPVAAVLHMASPGARPLVVAVVVLVPHAMTGRGKKALARGLSAGRLAAGMKDGAVGLSGLALLLGMERDGEGVVKRGTAFAGVETGWFGTSLVVPCCAIPSDCCWCRCSCCCTCSAASARAVLLALPICLLRLFRRECRFEGISLWLLWPVTWLDGRRAEVSRCGVRVLGEGCVVKI